MARKARAPAALRLASWCLPADVRDEVLVELCEQHDHIRQRRGAVAACLWAWRQPLAAARASRKDTGSGYSAPGKRLPLSFAFLWRDVVVAGRRLAKAPFFTIFAVVTLALGIGATTAVHSTIRTVTGPPPGVQHSERIVNIYNARIGGSRTVSGLSWPDFQDLRAQQTSFAALTAWSFFGAALAGDSGSTSAFGEIVDGNYFSLLGVQAHLGRVLQPADDRPDAPRVTVIGHALWQRLYGGDPAVVGRLVRINGQPFEIVGVAPREFRGLFNNGLVPGAVWIPLASIRGLAGLSQAFTLEQAARDERWLLVKGILNPKVPLERAATELSEIARRLDTAHPIETDVRANPLARRSWFPRPMTEVGLETDRQIVDALVMMLMLAVGAVLAVACTNVGNLVLARGASRAQDVAVRAALGASRSRLVFESLMETVLLSAAGGAAGLGVAKLLVTTVSRELLIPGTPATLMLEPRLDWTAIAAAMVAALGALGVAGLVPAVLSTRPRLNAMLASGNASTSTRWRGRRYLIVAQVTVSVMLLSLASVAASQLRAQRQHDPGLDLDALAVTRIHFESQGYDSARARQVLDGARAVLAGRTEVTGVAVASDLQAVTGTGYASVRLPGESRAHNVRLVAGASELLEIIGVPLRYGRAWSAHEAAGVTVISERMARDLFGVSDAVGRSVFLERPRADSLTVIGVAADTDVRFYGYGDPEGPLMYLPFDWDSVDTALLIARGRDGAEPLVPILRQAVAATDPLLVLEIADTARRLAGATALFYSIVAGIATLLGTLAWVLALGGLSGILAHLVHRRTREIGLRVALGARREHIVRMVVREGLRPVVAGVLAGLIVGAIARSLLQPQIERLIPATDLAVLTLVPLFFLGAAVFACYLPARRAARVDPIVALRDL